MVWRELLGLLLCVLAVYGLYALLCRWLAHGIPRGGWTIGVHADDLGQVPGALPDRMREASLVREANVEGMGRPVVLLEVPWEEDALDRLGTIGYAVYIRAPLPGQKGETHDGGCTDAVERDGRGRRLP